MRFSSAYDQYPGTQILDNKDGVVFFTVEQDTWVAALFLAPKGNTVWLFSEPADRARYDALVAHPRLHGFLTEAQSVVRLGELAPEDYVQPASAFQLADGMRRPYIPTVAGDVILCR